MTIRGILFDKDGTLLDYWKTWVPINCDAALFAEGGDTVLADELLRHGGHDPGTNHVASGSVLAVGSHDEIAAAFAAKLGARTPANLAQEIERLFREGGAKHSVLIEGVPETISALRHRGYCLGVATNDSAGGLQTSLGSHSLLDRFDFLAGCDSGFGVKPAPGMALAFCHAVGLDPSSVAVVGDAVHDLEMGRRAGVGLKIGVLSGTSVQQDLAPYADVVIGSVVELATHLAGVRSAEVAPPKA